jgi:hypothetical protein
MKLKNENNWNTEFVHHVPVAKIHGTNIITEEGLDSPLFRYNLYSHAEKRGIGQKQYYVTGWDTMSNTPLASIDGHLGKVVDAKFIELMTDNMYYNPSCMLWDMQKTLLSYAEAHDRLTGSAIVQEFMDGFDENGDGIIDYDENGKKGVWNPVFSIMSHALNIMMIDDYGALKGPFYQNVNFMLKNGNENWNPDGHDFAKEYLLMAIATGAYEMSQFETVQNDPFVPEMKWGKGMWPSWELARWTAFSTMLYGAQDYDQVNIASLYGMVFSYADKTNNSGLYTGSVDQMESDPKAVEAYFEAFSKGAKLLDFTLFVPEGFSMLAGKMIPNVEETNDPAKIFTAHFNAGKEIW